VLPQIPLPPHVARPALLSAMGGSSTTTSNGTKVHSSAVLEMLPERL